MACTHYTTLKVVRCPFCLLVDSRTIVVVFTLWTRSCMRDKTREWRDPNSSGCLCPDFAAKNTRRKNKIIRLRGWIKLHGLALRLSGMFCPADVGDMPARCPPSSWFWSLNSLHMLTAARWSAPDLGELSFCQRVPKNPSRTARSGLKSHGVNLGFDYQTSCKEPF